MKKVLLAIAALSLVVISLAGCPQTQTQSSAGTSGSSTTAQ